ncbi:MAG: TrkA family potassium uptake protein [Selenomonas sp.]|uniref:potassium channel family protein n=1 Tax=Selenomonas sp. TaxID=2053611 RepID=UPI0025F8CB42|nr:TrkA family potassium uptake protein [Selenomonas sp.]MCR5758728.1 TrkA family potassium uptake protein [Selenomonas sp.]
MKKSVLLIGLGRYGRHVAKNLHELNHEILAVDKDEELVNMVLPYVTNALTADSTDVRFLESLGVRNFDLCIVAIGDDFQSSLETTWQLKELGAKYVVARASRGVHEKFLLRNGADEVVYPEKQLARWTAIRFGYDHLLDYFELSDRYGVYELPMPPQWVGKTIVDLQVRQNYHVNILGVKKKGVLNVEITPQMVMQAEDTVLVLGKSEDLRRFFAI